MCAQSSRDNPSAFAIRVRGLVQGVGFRPTVWQLAQQKGLDGDVINDSQGVLIRLACNRAGAQDFCSALKQTCPPLGRIDAMEITPLDEPLALQGFHIGESQGGSVATGIVADAATCPACLADIAGPANRRHGYPFTNCTHCGPRLSIIRALPYDRAQTSMADFPMCTQCRAEYENPADRRFHAQPNACPDCGPHIWLSDINGATLCERADALAQCADYLQQGRIIAIRGLGGYHLACNALDEQAITTLRTRKHREAKPLALMVRDMEMAHHYAQISDEEAEMLQSREAPIILLHKSSAGDALPDPIAPDQNRLGIMLPYSPLHHLLLGAVDAPLVLTSANLSGEPQITGNDEALKKLAGIADYLLMHNREIVNRVDDSVVHSLAGDVSVIRRGRGFAPETLILPPGFEDAPSVLAMGAQLKSTFCLLRRGEAIVSQHMGDLENALVNAEYRRALALYLDCYDFAPESIARDHHPGFFSSQWGEHLAAEHDIACETIQHHHAHLAAAMAEYGLPIDSPPVIGVIFDGFGLGADDGIWGGEFLLGDYRDYKRCDHLPAVALPGGDAAALQPWRNLVAQIHTHIGMTEFETRYGETQITRWLSRKPVNMLVQIIDKQVNSPLSSSMGRLFDAMAAMLLIHPERQAYEGQAAMALQALAERAQIDLLTPYPLAEMDAADWGAFWRAMLDDLRDQAAPEAMAARFHLSLATLVLNRCTAIRTQYGADNVVLSGGVFQNALLAGLCHDILKKQGFTALLPRSIPANDGGIALGQAVITAARFLDQANT